MWRRAANDERGLSTLEWILLVAAVGGLATAGVIIVRNAVGGAGDQVDDDARTERLAQIDVNTVLRSNKDGNRLGGATKAAEDAKIKYGDVRTRCDFEYKYNDGTYPLRKWRGSFTLNYVIGNQKSGSSLTNAQKGTPTDAEHWCDAVPTNNLSNNPAYFAEPIRINYTADTCVRWPDHDNWGTEDGGVNPRDNKPC